MADENGAAPDFAILHPGDYSYAHGSNSAAYPAAPAAAKTLLKNDGGVTISRRAFGSVVTGCPLSSISSSS
jgi:hypothetical protein